MLWRNLHNTMFRDWERSSMPSSYPQVRLYVGTDSTVAVTELPGVDANDIDISIHNQTLTLTATRKRDELEKGGNLLRQERSHGKFNRAIKLPYRVDAAHVEASLTDGVLKVLLQRAEEDKPKKITVKAA